MKKVFAILIAISFVACTNGSATQETVDSVAAQVDTAAVSAIDSTVACLACDSAAHK